MREVAMVAAGMTQFGELWKSSLRDMFVEAAAEAMNQAGVDHLDDIYVGNMSGGQFVGQEHVAPLMVDHLGLAGVCATRVESACASGGAALRLGYMAVGSGMSDVVLVAGVEKMTDGADVTSVLASAADQETEVYHGITFPGLYAMIARAHMEAHGTTEEDMAWVSVKNHAHGAKNPKAQFPRVITVDDVMNSSMVADPMRLLNCSPVSDGAAAVLLCPLDQAHKYTDNPVRITGSGQATGSMALADRKDPAVLEAVALSGERAFKMAGVAGKDIDVAEVHDCFSISEICCVEALSLVCTGEGASAAREGITALGGSIPVNTSGGLKAKGHPVGATMGGSGASSVVHIFERA